MKEIKKALSEFDKDKVDIFVDYLKRLQIEKDKEGKIVAWWFSKIKGEDFVSVFKKVYETGLFIDGDSITLNYRKKLIVTFDYHAYKNKIMISYPETIFDFQVVYEGDTFNFRKESGKVEYDHLINEPFAKDKKIVGAYGVMKNKRGEFIELLNMQDIEKMKNTSTMKNIWNTWFDRMVLKSVIKRTCAIHFKDITKAIDEIDNETNGPTLALIGDEIQNELEEAKTVEDVTAIYKSNIETVEDKDAFILLCGKRKKELIK